MQNDILKLLQRTDYAPSNVPELLNLLSLPPSQQQKLQRELESLTQRGQVVRTKGNRYIYARDADLLAGTITLNRAGKGFFQPDEPGLPEIVIPEHAVGTAMHGDKVLVRQDRPRQGGKAKDFGGGSAKPPGNDLSSIAAMGAVVKILERKRLTAVGTLQRQGRFLYVIPDDGRLPRHILVPTPKDVGRPANEGDKVVVEFVAWESPEKNPEGEVIEVLGAPDDDGVDMLSVIRHYGLDLHFPKEVLAEANQIAAEQRDVAAAARKDKRLDCRHHDVITIDPDDAKDFDDAICLQDAGDNKLRLWVHIADVSHYVKPDSALERESSARGNSTYLVDRVVPMLPEALSNDLCSLKPNVDRLTKAVEFLMTRDGKVLSTQFHSAIIHSKKRFSYQEALGILQRQPTPNDPLEQMLHAANDLAQKVRQRRFRNGALALDNPENKIRLDERGKVVRIERMENDISHQLIEEYMLLANEAVAGRLMELDSPAIYRVHEAPKTKRLIDFREEVLAQKIPCGDLTKRVEVQKLLERLSTLPMGDALKIGLLRSLMRARYAVEPLGHYGLNKTRYCHFTSPIRRYADLVVHRSLFGKKPQPLTRLHEVSLHISGTERNSADAERDSKEVKLYAYLREQLSTGKLDSYDAMVLEVRPFGFFVDVPALGLSGLVHLSSIAGDFYELDSRQSQLRGRRTNHIIRVGSRLSVQVATVDSFKKRVDFTLAPAEGQSQTPASPGQRFRPKGDKGKVPQQSNPSRRPQSEKGKPKDHGYRKSKKRS